MQTETMARIARVNGVAINTEGEELAEDELRSRACTELLRQSAQCAGLLSPDDTATPDGLISEEAAMAIDALIGQAVQVPEPSDEACRRHYSAHLATYTEGERLHLRHILFAVTPGVDVVLLRKRAEAVLLDVRSHADGEDLFLHAAEEFSNCPSGAKGGDLGWLTASDCAPEFARALFGQSDFGVLPRLVHSRFGLHVVEVLEREPGEVQAFESVRGTVAAALRQQSFVTALRQYLALLAGSALLEGVELESADTPLVQ